MTTAVHASPRRISNELRIALDAIRAMAAVYVVVHHVIASWALAGPVTYVFRFGQEAVIVFFLLSGFLIFASEKSRVQSDLGGYYLRRLRRIYPLLAVAMAVTGVVVWMNGTITQDFSVSQLVWNLLSMQDVSALKPGVIADPFLGNSPLWSLSYEVFFYLAFPLVMVARRISRKVALTVVGVTSLIGYGSFLLIPNHFSLVFSYLLVWWAGAVVADLYSSNVLTYRHLLPVSIWLGALSCAAFLAVVLNGGSGVGVFPILPLRHFAFALLCVSLCGSALKTAMVRVALPYARPAAYVASISYGLYVLHYPLLIQWEGAHTPLGFVLAVFLLVVLSILGDRVLDKVLPRTTQKI